MSCDIIVYLGCLRSNFCDHIRRIEEKFVTTELLLSSSMFRAIFQHFTDPMHISFHQISKKITLI